MAVDQGYGIDTSIFLSDGTQDLDTTFGEINDVNILLQDVYKGITTPSEAVVVIDGNPPAPCLWWETPPVSFDIRDYFNDSVDYTISSLLRNRIEDIYVDDLRFFNGVEAAVTFAQNTITATVTGTAVTGQNLQLVVTAGSDVVQIQSAS